MWRPVWRRRDSHSGFRTERENLIGDAKRKGDAADILSPGDEVADAAARQLFLAAYAGITLPWMAAARPSR